MKKIAAFVLAAAMAMSLAACGSGNSAPAAGSAASAAGSAAASAPAAAPVTTVEKGKLIMSTNAAFAPYESVADDGKGYEGTGYEGIDVEIAYAIAQKLGLQLEIDDMDFSAAVNAPAQGKADMCMAGLTVMPDRQKNLDFSDSYANGVQVIIVPNGSAIKSVDDLSKVSMIGTQEGTTGYVYCSADPADKGYGEDHVTAYTDGATAIQALLAKKVDCVVIDQAPAKEFVKANPSLKILDTEFSNENYAIAVKKGNTDLLNAINGALKDLTSDGTIKSVIDKYIPAA